jgi:hypothetical protein
LGSAEEAAVSATGEATAPDDEAADRIEQALERIAALAARPRAVDGEAASLDPAPAPRLDLAIAPRLDAVIERVRLALGS